MSVGRDLTECHARHDVLLEAQDHDAISCATRWSRSMTVGMADRVFSGGGWLSECVADLCPAHAKMDFSACDDVRGPGCISKKRTGCDGG